MYYCHQCHSFYAVRDNSRDVVECVACHSPLVEAVRSAAHREELQRLMEQQQRAEEDDVQQQLLRQLGLLDGVELQFHGPGPQWHLFHLFIPGGGEAPSGPPVDELMRSFRRFPHGLREGDRTAHPEAFLESACLICLEPLQGGGETEREGPSAATSTAAAGIEGGVTPPPPPQTTTTTNTTNTTNTTTTESSTEGQPVVMLPCKHCYHEECIRTWLQQSRQCPLCRASVLPRETTENIAPSAATPAHAGEHDN
ncbi:zinc finger protein [Trypanosoma melophagium]|uniref:zinc finger protein n=1 Tax=Trypanosoma melophagium TaxID=715481 RepID=UPI00351A24BA|nr:zinc finger protein [Trypanosoma melophagium]